MVDTARVKQVSFKLLKWGALLAAILLLALGVAVGISYNQLPSFEQLKTRSDLGQTIRLRAQDGSVLVEMGPKFGRWLPSEEIPETMKAAMVAVEDRRFYAHPGVDPIGITRGIFVSLKDGGGVRGVSTIPQQLARNIFLTPRRELVRKMKEGVIALALDMKFSKDEILELYLNRVYFGGGAYGIDAASNTFYGHGAQTLSLGEAAIIAGLVKAPSNYSPTADVDAARGRAGVVLSLMVDHGFIDQATANAVDPATIRLEKRAAGNSARYFTDWALPQLDTLIDETRAPLDVWTTLDTDMQAYADAAINANAPGGTQGALVSIDEDGAVRAMVGGKDYVESIYNRATAAERQPGSAFKLFVYLAALENGFRPDDVLVDEPVDIRGWSPRNYTRTYSGPMTMREAFARSINTVSAKLGEQVGFTTVAQMANRFGIRGEISTYPSMVLGTSEVRLIDMTRAFASVANEGVSVPPYAITRVETADGDVLYRHQPGPQRVLVSPWIAADMTEMMQAAVQTGTARAANIGRPTAGKTGTTSSNKDGWFIGFSSGLTTGVWYGRDDARAVAGLGGGSAPARAFADFMRRAVADRPVENFEKSSPTPEWQVEPDDEAWMIEDPMFDEDGNLIDPVDPLAPRPDGATPPTGNQDVDREWLDEVLRRDQGRADQPRGTRQPGASPPPPRNMPPTVPPSPTPPPAPPAPTSDGSRVVIINSDGSTRER